jgi:hypothetical protein
MPLARMLPSVMEAGRGFIPWAISESWRAILENSFVGIEKHNRHEREKKHSNNHYDFLTPGSPRRLPHAVLQKRSLHWG